MEKQRVIAVDFDGCLCDNAYPDIGAPNWQVIDAALKERADGAALILWTCREGDMLQQALDACKGWGLEFDAVNDSLPKWKETWKNDPRKIGATEYWDDKAVRMPNIDPVTAAAEALGMSPDRLRELAQAEKEGRLVVLPCKDWFEIVFGEQELFWGIDTDYIETPIREISVDNAERFTWYDGWKTLVLRGNDENGLDWEFSPEGIGKTVFLTREAAEAALDAMGGENNA